MGLTAAVPSNHVSPLQGEGSGQTLRDKGGRRERESEPSSYAMGPFRRTRITCVPVQEDASGAQSAAKNVSERAENVPGLRTGQTI